MMEKIKKGMFMIDNGPDVEIKKIGDLFDPWYGFDVITLSRQHVDALFQGNVLATNVLEEYGVLIRLKED